MGMGWFRNGDIGLGAAKQGGFWSQVRDVVRRIARHAQKDFWLERE